MLISPSQQQAKNLSRIIFLGFLILLLTAVFIFGYSQYKKSKTDSSQIQPYKLEINQSAFEAAKKRINP